MSVQTLDVTEYASGVYSNPDYNYNTSIYMGTNNTFACLKLNANAIPVGKYISSAVITLRADPSTFGSVKVQENTEDFASNLLTYNTRPAIGSLVSFSPVFVANDYVSMDVTEIFKKQYESGLDYGITMLRITGPTLGSFVTSPFPTIEITYFDTIPSIPSPVYPLNVSVDRAKDLTIKWNGSAHINTNLIWNDGTEHNVIIAGNSFEYTIPANTMALSTVTWKVRQEYTTVGYSEFSDIVSFNSVNKPVTPVIVETTATLQLPTFTWSATNQTKFNFIVEKDGELIVDYTTYTNTQTYTLTTELIDNTEYDFSVRYTDSNELWSDFDTNTITTNFNKPGAVSFAITNLTDHASITIANGIDTSYNQILKLIDGVYTEIKYAEEDGTALVYELISGKQESIKVRAYSSEGGFIDSTVKYVTINVEDSHIITFDLTEEMDLKFNPRYTVESQKSVISNYFEGRKKKIAIAGVQDSRTPNVSFELLNYADVEKLLTFRGKKILVRNSRGLTLWCVVPRFKERYNTRSTIVSFIDTIEVER